MKTYFLFICAICCYLTGNAHSTEYNIFQFGASKDTSVVQTQAINAAIENWSPARRRQGYHSFRDL